MNNIWILITYKMWNKYSNLSPDETLLDFVSIGSIHCTFIGSSKLPKREKPWDQAAKTTKICLKKLNDCPWKTHGFFTSNMSYSSKPPEFPIWDLPRPALYQICTRSTKNSLRNKAVGRIPQKTFIMIPGFGNDVSRNLFYQSPKIGFYEIFGLPVAWSKNNCLTSQLQVITQNVHKT